MGAKSKRKGSSGEREASNKLFDLSGVRMARNLDQVRAGGHDLIIDTELSVATPQMQSVYSDFAIEVKRYATLALSGWWKQTVAQANRYNNTPVLMYRIDRQRHWTVVVPLWFLLHPKFEGKNYRTIENTSLEFTASMTLEAFVDTVRVKFCEPTKPKKLEQNQPPRRNRAVVPRLL